MPLGPIQLVVLGFEHPDFHGEIIAKLNELHDAGAVRVIDALAVHKDADGEVEVQHLSNLTRDEAIEVGSAAGALIGLGIDGEDGFEAGALAGAGLAAGGGGGGFGGGGAGGALSEMPNHPAARGGLLEHRWALPLRDAVARAGGFRISDGFVSPLDLVEIGLVTADEAQGLHDFETRAHAGATNSGG